MQKDMVVMALLELLRHSEPSGELPLSHARRKQVLDGVRDYLCEGGESPVTITELCELTHVSRRTLQYSFETVIGVSPHQFLAAMRLNPVRRALCQPDNTRSITDIATYWGSYHLGQFARAYRDLFGGTPSRTRELHRPLI